MEQHVGMSKSKGEKIQNKNPRTMMGIYLANLGLSKTSRLCSLTNAVELITGNGHVFGISSKHVSKKSILLVIRRNPQSFALLWT